MKSTSTIENSLIFSELDNRLQKQPYLSKSSLPGSLDAKVFKIVKDSGKIPDRKIHPNLYHWFIIMKQFASTALQKWIQNGDEDQKSVFFILEVQKGLSLQKDKPLETIKVQSKEVKDDSAQCLKLTELQTDSIMKIQKIKSTPLQIQQFQEVLVLQLRPQLTYSPQQIKNKIEKLKQFYKLTYRVQPSCFIVSKTDKKLQEFRISFKGNSNLNETIKNQISQWPQLVNIQIKKEKNVGKSKPQQKVAQKQIFKSN